MKFEVLKNLFDMEEGDEIKVLSFDKNILMNIYNLRIEVIRKEERK